MRVGRLLVLALVLSVGLCLPSAASADATPFSSSPLGNGDLMGSPDPGGAVLDTACRAGGLSTVARTNCAASGTAMSAYPASNFGTDTHVDTGWTKATSDGAALVQQTVGWVIGISASVLSWVLTGLGWAFGFDLFGSDQAGRIPASLHGVENLFTTHLLPLAVLISGAVGLIYMLGHRHEARALRHWLAFAACVVIGLFVIGNPVGALSWASTGSNLLSQAALGAFTNSGGGGTASYANVEPGIWRMTMERSWCSLEFGAVDWCMSPVDPAMARGRTSVLAHLPQALGDQGTAQLARQQAPLERRRLLAAQTNGELFLSFPTNSDARNGINDDWTLYHALVSDQPQLTTIRGVGGVGGRLTGLVLAAIAGVAFVLLIGCIAWQIVANSIFFIVCLLLLPFAALAPAAGERGLSVFLRVVGWMLEALGKKVFFAIYLGVLLDVSNLVYSIASQMGWAMGWLALGACWAMGLVYQYKILRAMTADGYHQHGRPHVPSWAKTAYTMYALNRSSPQPVTVANGDTHIIDQSQNLHLHGQGHGQGQGQAPVRVPNQGNWNQLPPPRP